MFVLLDLLVKIRLFHLYNFVYVLPIYVVTIYILTNKYSLMQ